MISKILLGLCLVLMSNNSFSQTKKKADKNTQEWKYEIEVVSVGVQGTYLVKVWSYSKKPNVAIEQAKKNAVHGIIFKGFAGKPGVSGQKALTSNPALEQEQAAFFKDFFADGGKFMKFVSLTNDGAVAAGDVLKVGKEYKIGVIVSVNVAYLRKDLESAGIIKGLGNGF
jgi:DNA polymerase III alpha subunit